jgi:hypothetical protein
MIGRSTGGQVPLPVSVTWTAAASAALSFGHIGVP